jgi:hypothetical protein
MNTVMSFQRSAVAVLLGWVLVINATAAPVFPPPRVLLSGQAAPKPSSAVCGFALIAKKTGPQAAIMGPDLLASIRADEHIEIIVEAQKLTGPFSVSVRVNLTFGRSAIVSLTAGTDASVEKTLQAGAESLLDLTVEKAGERTVIRLKPRANRACDGETFACDPAGENTTFRSARSLEPTISALRQ